MSPKIKMFQAVLAACIGAAALGPAIAQDSSDIVVRGKPLPDGAEQRIVRIADLNLRSEAGEREMERRVRMAVESICNTSNGNQPLSEERLDEECREGAWDSARPQMNAALARARSSGY